ncbi:methionine ABC transporter ATP-binding protein [Enterococcus alishanensis]|uniref:ATP-binding cassette domain-containing protein n=1 Tax=Enterococcus alishanensis TaxID=1303817 RepID=A0ABS6T977_9ENTE|nr:ATP-binding cassette domain-containing protein [Enterococcus alishanensis]MBV7389445.1 ATP-binding cassette domain-containing protein [Enterococcus alishanensis]
MGFIELSQVVKTFSGKVGTVHAVQGINLTVEKGDVFGIVGYSGAGKSTLVRLLNGLETPTAGEVIVDGEDITKLKGNQLRQFRKKVGMIFQHFNILWSRTVLENIQLPLELAGVPKERRKGRAEELLKLVGLEGRGNAYPSQLSGGQKQRVGIARALANDPDILLCDEATSALDPQTTEEVLELLADINQQLGLTIVLITHEMNVVRKICNKVAVMELGKIVEEGNVQEVFRHPQQAVTKIFVQQELEPKNDPAALLAEFIKENPTGTLASLQFVENNAGEPVVSQAIRNFDVNVSIIYGNIERAAGNSFGTLTVQLTGSEVTKAIEFFESQKVGVEVLHHG